jgi:hypothetical protein
VGPPGLLVAARFALRAGVEADAVLSHRWAMLGSNLEPRDYESHAAKTHFRQAKQRLDIS